MESEPPIEQKNVLSDTDTEATNTNPAVESETCKDSISETDSVRTDLAEYQIENCSGTHQAHNELSDLVPKKGVYPDLELCSENTTYQYKNDLNENPSESESSKMGCTSGKENSEELENDIPYSKSKDGTDFTDASENNAFDEHKLLGKQEVPAVCRHKEPVELNNPIVSSFSPRQSAKSETDEIPDCTRVEAEANVAAAKDESNTNPSHSSSEKHFPGKAVRVKDAYNNEVDEHIRGRKRNATKEKKGRHGHEKANDKKTDNIEDTPFRGIDQKWKTNDDDEWEAAHEKFEYFWKADSIYSQWYYSVFFDDNYKFTCAEQYMMYRKAVLFGDCRIMNKILEAASPRKMKSLGRKVSGFSDEIWNANCLDIVKQANIAKFSQNKHLKKKLLNTYPKILVEASPADAIWGIGCAEDDPDAWDESTWRGTNYLGYVITEIRDELLVDEKFITPEEKQVFLPKLKEQMQQSKNKARSSSEETAFKERVHIPEEGTDVDEGFKKSEGECRIKETVNSMEEGQSREEVNHLEDGIATKDVVFSVEARTEAKEDVDSLEVGTEAKEDVDSLEVGTETKGVVQSLGNEAEATEAFNSLGNEAEAKETVNSLGNVAEAKEAVNSQGNKAEAKEAANSLEDGTEAK